MHAGIAVADAGGEFLRRRVVEDVDRVGEPDTPASGDCRQAVVLERTRVAVARRQEVVADGDRVLALFGGPELRPFGHGRVVGERPRDAGVVVGQVVFGQQVEDEGGADGTGDGCLGLVPGVVPVTAALFPRDDFVGVPVLATFPVRVHERPDVRFDGPDQFERFSGDGQWRVPGPGWVGWGGVSDRHRLGHRGPWC